jgi:hypothetical protein
MVVHPPLIMPSSVRVISSAPIAPEERERSVWWELRRTAEAARFVVAPGLALGAPSQLPSSAFAGAGNRLCDAMFRRSSSVISSSCLPLYRRYICPRAPSCRNDGMPWRGSGGSTCRRKRSPVRREEERRRPAAVPTGESARLSVVSSRSGRSSRSTLMFTAVHPHGGVVLEGFVRIVHQ